MQRSLSDSINTNEVFIQRINRIFNQYYINSQPVLKMEQEIAKRKLREHLTKNEGFSITESVESLLKACTTTMRSYGR